MDTIILVVEDDGTLRELLKYNLQKEGYGVLTARDGGEALELYDKNKPQLIILDIMLPVINGTEVCRIIRGKSQIPIIMLTAKTEEVDKVVGLELGADDYVTKPFSPCELLTRVKAVLRRAEARSKVEDICIFGSVKIDFKKYQVLRGDKEIKLTAAEFKILKLLVSSRGEPVSRHKVLSEIWTDENVTTRTIDLYYEDHGI